MLPEPRGACSGLPYRSGRHLCFFGYNEALRGDEGLAGFEKDLAEMIDSMRAQRYNGESAPRLVVVSPIAHEDLYSSHLPDGSENNASLAKYTEAMRRVCADKEVTFVDLLGTTRELYARATQPLTLNGIHLLDHGNRQVAQVVIEKLFPGKTIPVDVTRLREAVLDKNYHWFSRYRVVDGYNVFGGRSTLSWHRQSNAVVLDDGRIITGMIVEENDDEIQVVINPLAKDRATVIEQDAVVGRKKATVSLMPTGLLDRLTREEILDLLAYVYAKGDKKHKLFQDHAHH